MTDSQQLLAEYAKSGSEAAFRELVTRYFGLVYSTALRLVGGDTHLAEDVAQTVFSDLARKAHGLSSEVMLGGWLHQHTYNVAAPMMRAQRRRQSREREAAQMNALQDDPGADLAQVAPVLDEVIMSLGTEDRTAIMLCFFERRDFRSIGQALGSSEDAARMRVNRALDKLHTLLTHRGVTLSAAALGTALATEAVTAAPAGLAGSVAGAALASAAAGGGTALPFLKAMTMTKLKLGVVSAIVVAGAVTPLVVQHDSIVELREENQSLRLRAEQQAPLPDKGEGQAKPQQSDQIRSNSMAALPEEQLRELLRLRGQVGVLKTQLHEASEKIAGFQFAADVAKGFQRLENLKLMVAIAKLSLDDYASALNVPETVAKTDAQKGMDDPDLQKYRRYFVYKGQCEALQTNLDELMKPSSPAQ